jgi:hypothetical protein
MIIIPTIIIFLLHNSVHSKFIVSLKVEENIMFDYLKKLFSLRQKQAQIQNQIDEIMPDAIAESIKIAEGIPNQTVYLSEQGKIVLKMMPRFATPKEDIVLARLDEDILAQTAYLAQLNAKELAAIASKIEHLKAQISELEIKQNQLLTNDYIKRLKKEFYDRQNASAFFNPSLAIYLGKMVKKK